MSSSHLPTWLSSTFARFGSWLDRRSAARVPILLTGMLFASGRRTVTSWFRAAGIREEFRPAYATVCADAASGHKAARSAVQLAATRLATAALTLINVLDIQRIVLGGPALLDDIAEEYITAIRAAIGAQPYTRQLRDVTVERSQLGVDAAAFGAASSVFHEVMAPRLPLLVTAATRRPRSRVLSSLAGAT